MVQISHWQKDILAQGTNVDNNQDLLTVDKYISLRKPQE